MPSVFTHIINGDLPGHFVWKDAEAVAFLTIQPIREGHVLVVPRAEIDHWDAVPEATAAHLMRVARRIAHGIKAAWNPGRVSLIIAGFEVPHTHLHLIPADDMGDLSFARARSASKEELAAAATTLREALRAQGNAETDF
jgi:histidine triad (HIT) family protein